MRSSATRATPLAPGAEDRRLTAAPVLQNRAGVSRLPPSFGSGREVSAAAAGKLLARCEDAAAVDAASAVGAEDFHGVSLATSPVSAYFLSGRRHAAPSSVRTDRRSPIASRLGSPSLKSQEIAFLTEQAEPLRRTTPRDRCRLRINRQALTSERRSERDVPSSFLGSAQLDRSDARVREYGSESAPQTSRRPFASTVRLFRVDRFD